MPLREQSVTLPHLEPDGWWFEVDDRHRGPYATEGDAHAKALRLFRQWSREAKRLGGWVWKSDATCWCTYIPDEVKMVGGKPFIGKVMVRH